MPVERSSQRGGWSLGDTSAFVVLLLLFFVVAGNPAPAVNEAHYLVKAKHYWDPQFLANDPFVSSANAHLAYYWLIGWLTEHFSLPTVAWIGRFVGWAIVAAGLTRLVRKVTDADWASCLVGLVWIVGVQEGNLAGEWVIGGIEAKVFAYGLLFWGWNAMLRGAYAAGWILLGLSSALHVLVGGWGVIATLVARGLPGMRVAQRVCWTRREMVGLGVGGACSLVGVLPVLGLGSGGEADAANWAAQIQVYGRLSHHLNPASFPLSWFLHHGAVLGLTLLLGWRIGWGDGGKANEAVNPGLKFVLRLGCASTALGCCGLLIGVVPAFDRQLGANLLRFYWFRLGDAVVPLVLGMLVAHWLFWCAEGRGKIGYWQKRVALVVCGISLVVIARDYFRDYRLSMPESVAQGNLIGQPGQEARSSVSTEAEVVWTQPAEVYSDWLAVCRWIALRTPESAVFITPRHQQTFKWYAGRAEVVNWKDMPQDAVSIVDWGRRLNRVFPLDLGRRHPPVEADTLSQLAADYGAGYLVIDRRWVPRVDQFLKVYPGPGEVNQTYWVYQLERSPLRLSSDID